MTQNKLNEYPVLIATAISVSNRSAIAIARFFRRVIAR
jgi:hypothetical protein